MTDDNRKLEDTLRRLEPEAPPAELRERILSEARRTRRSTRRRWAWRLGVAAVLLAALIVGAGIEQAETDACRAILAARAPSRAEEDADRLAADVAAMLDGDGLAERIRQQFRFQLAMRQQEEEIQVLRRMMPERFHPSTQE